MATPGKILSRTSTRKSPSAPKLSSQSPDKKVLSKNAETAHCCSYISQLSITETESAKKDFGHILEEEKGKHQIAHISIEEKVVSLFSAVELGQGLTGGREDGKNIHSLTFFEKNCSKGDVIGI